MLLPGTAGAAVRRRIAAHEVHAPYLVEIEVAQARAHGLHARVELFGS